MELMFISFECHVVSSGMKDVQEANEKLNSIWPIFGDLFIYFDWFYSNTHIKEFIKEYIKEFIKEYI